jgi:membrane protein DedA with SNARE-associated domain
MRILIFAALGGLGTVLWLLGYQTGIAEADSEPPSLPLLQGGAWSTVDVVVVCVVAVVVVAVGIFFIRRARAKRRASGPGAGR